MERGDMFDVSNIEIADIVMLETEIPSEFHTDIFDLLSRLKLGARTLTYLDLHKLWPTSMCQFKQVLVNKSLADRCVGDGLRCVLAVHDSCSRASP